jgi:hypothetical protein
MDLTAIFIVFYVLLSPWHQISPLGGETSLVLHQSSEARMTHIDSPPRSIPHHHGTIIVSTRPANQQTPLFVNKNQAPKSEHLHIFVSLAVAIAIAFDDKCCNSRSHWWITVMHCCYGRWQLPGFVRQVSRLVWLALGNWSAQAVGTRVRQEHAGDKYIGWGVDARGCFVAVGERRQWIGHGMTSGSLVSQKILWAFCERELLVLTKFCERHRKSSEAICQIFTKNPGLSGELIPFLSTHKITSWCGDWWYLAKRAKYKRNNKQIKCILPNGSQYYCPYGAPHINQKLFLRHFLLCCYHLSLHGLFASY